MKSDSHYMILPTVTKDDERDDNPKLWHVRSNRRCRWHDLPENWRVKKRCERRPKREITSVELLEPGEPCKVLLNKRWHQALVWFFCEWSPRVWLVVYPYSNSSYDEPFPYVVDLDERLVALPAEGAGLPGPMPGWAG
ncbi:hypothetical protein ACFLYO_00365 [Chloroflexota bacterium]